MKRVLWVALFLGLCVSVASAQFLVGAKNGGMGGTGVASATDLNAVYYNPAGLMKAGRAEFKLSVYPSYTDYQKLLDAYSQSTDPSGILEDNVANNLSFQGDLTGLVGFQVNKIGLSAMITPLGKYAGHTLTANNTVNINKQENALQGDATYSVRQDTILTLGHTFSFPWLPFTSLDAGANLKMINAVYGTLDAAIGLTSAPYYKGTGTGTAFDLGARTSMDVPVVGSLAMGLAVRDVAGQINYQRKEQRFYFNTLTNTITKGAETDLADRSVTLDPVTVVGVAATLPTLSLGMAADMEFTRTDTITHLGLEYPLMANVLIGRAGLATSDSVSKTTVGVKLNLPFLTLDTATVMDGKNSSVMGWIVDIGVGF